MIICGKTVEKVLLICGNLMFNVSLRRDLSDLATTNASKCQDPRS